MITTKGKRRKLLALLLAVAEPCAAAGITGVAVLLSSTVAAAQTAWGVSRRTARRTSRRTVGRQEAIYHGGAAYPYIYSLPLGYRTVVVGGTTYYEAEGERYEAKIVEGQTVYVQVP